MLKNSKTEYGSVTKFFHWTIGVLILGMLAVGAYMADYAPKDLKGILYMNHKAVGVIVLMLVLARILWKFQNQTPAYPESMPGWQKKSAIGLHHVLYIIMFLMPLSGYVMSVAGGHSINMWGWQVPDLISPNKPLAGLAHEAHETIAAIFYVVLPIHIGAALYHYFIQKDNILQRMLPRRKQCCGCSH